MNRFITKRLQLLTVAVTCLGLGAGASVIATADANTKAHSKAPKAAAHMKRAVLLRGLARRTVEGSFVVATKSGFANVTVARGSVQSVNGDALTLVEGTRKQSYRTATLTLPATVRVRDNRQTATLTQLTAGQRAVVIIGPNRALVVAHTPKRA